MRVRSNFQTQIALSVSRFGDSDGCQRREIEFTFADAKIPLSL